MSNQQADTVSFPAHVVVGVDGSASSIGALRAGARIADALHLPLEAVTAWQLPDLYGGYMGETFVPDLRGLADGAAAMLDDTVSAVFGATPPPWFHGTVREGRTAQTLIDAGAGAEMLVVGSRGHGGFVGLLLGSVSQACAEHASCPVLVFHDDQPAPAAA